MKHKSIFFLFIIGCITNLSAATWNLGGGRIYFDNSLTQWNDEHIMLLVGKDNYTAVYEFTQNGSEIYCTLPSGWSDATYMAVIGASDTWGTGNFGPDNRKVAPHYTGRYTAGLTSSAGQWYKLTPSGKENNSTLSLTWLGDNNPQITFSSEDKNHCYTMNAKESSVTFLYSTSDKRFNRSRSSIREVYVCGSFTEWNMTKTGYRMNNYSDDGCFFLTLPFDSLAKIGNSGQPEFCFHVHLSDDGWSTEHHNASWGANFDKRYLFIANGENMVVAMPCDDIDEIYSRCEYAQYVPSLSQWDLTDVNKQLQLANFRCVPGTKYLYRSYHPFDPSHQQYDTEERRLYYVAKAAANVGIQCDIALSGDKTLNAGKTYSCGGKTYTITIPEYYKSIIANKNVLYVGTKNGHTPEYNDAIYHSDSPRFAEWIQEVVEFILDDKHPVPFEIHCAIGADRTGAFCATIAALCDAPWEDVAHDYESTSQMRIQEYRHRNTIRYCIRHLCGVDPATDANYNEAVKQHFIQGGYLTADQIADLKAKLNPASPTGIEAERLIGGKADGKTLKLLRNGNIYLINGGRIYNATGAELR